MKGSRFKCFPSAFRFTFSYCSVFIFLILNSPIARAQNAGNLNIEKVLDDGLKNNYINCLTQDTNGFMWFGTAEGLFRYDGYNFRGFANVPGNSAFLSNQSISCIYPDNDNLWVGYLGGISVIDINKQSIKNYPSPGSLLITCFYSKNDTAFWVGTNSGLFQFNKRTSGWTKISVPDKGVGINSINDDNKGHLYLVSINNICCFTKSTGKFSCFYPHLPVYPKVDKITCPNMNRSLLDKDGNLWISTWGGGLLKFNPNTHAIAQWMHPSDDLHLLPYYIIIDLLADKANNIWLANKEGGLTIFNPANNTFTNYPVEWQSDNKISGAVTHLFRDRSGIIWIGTENGIFKYDPNNTHLSKTELLLKTDTGLSPAHIFPSAMLKDKYGLFWMGMYEGVFLFDQKKNMLYDYNKILGLPPNLAVFNILPDPNGSVWLTARNLLLNVSKKKIAGHTLLIPDIYGMPEMQSTITNLYIDKENRFWLGTHRQGIYWFKPATKKFTTFNYHEKAPGPGIKEVHTFCEISKDSILAGGGNTGLLLLHPNTNRYEKIQWENVPKNASINDIHRVGQNLWIGTENSGLLETDIRFKKPLIITSNDGLPSMDIAAIVTDKQNNLWMLTNAGVVKFQTSDNRITVFDKKDGILNLDKLNSIFIENDTVIIGGRGCIYSLTPAQILKNRQPPKVFITNLKIFDKDYSVQKSKPIELGYNQNYFSLEYVALNYTRSKFNRYAYKMDGLDKKWNDAGPRRYVSYANLEEGTYTFNVKACNSDGVWNNLPAKLVLIISPPIWHRWWFYFLIVIVVLGVIYIVYQYNIKQFKIRLQMRDKIARDLHDDIGSTLSGINIFSKIALQQMAAGQPGMELMEKISERSKVTMDALSDIVWSINTRNDGMDNFLVKATEYLSILEVQGIPYDFAVDKDIRQLKIGMIPKKELYLIFKEAVCNASKYANCTFIQISLTRNKDTFTLSIHDNGKGFDINKLSDGNGIYNMRERAKRMGAELKIESGENKGTTIVVNFRITRFR